jgi:hypothetical protein
LNLHRFVSSIAAGTDRNTDSLTRRIASKNKLAGWPWAHGTSHVALFGKIARPESNPTLTRNPGWGYFGQFGCAWCGIDVESADRATRIRDLLDVQ